MDAQYIPAPEQRRAKLTNYLTVLRERMYDAVIELEMLQAQEPHAPLTPSATKEERSLAAQYRAQHAQLIREQELKIDNLKASIDVVLRMLDEVDVPGEPTAPV